MQASAIHNGTVMQGEYLLLEPIHGAAGEVFRGQSQRGGRAVTIRLWRGNAATIAERVLEKPQLAGRLQHPMIAAVEACGRESDGTWFIVSEAVAGQPLSEWADEVGIPPISSIVDFMHRLCQGLSAAHREGLEHDAFNPDSVVVLQRETQGRQRLSGKILDIGVPAFMYPSPPSLQAAQFMAPEQLAACMRLDGAPLNADARMNVYSCGCLLYHLCTGGPPFPSHSLEELTQAHAEGKLVPPSKINPQLSPSLESVILRALALQRSERHVSATELASALTRVRLSASSSGVRQLGDSTGGRRADDSSRPAQNRGVAFDERPTSETRLPSDLPGKTLAPPAASSATATPPEFDARSARPTLETQRAASKDTPRDSWSPPAGSFSSAPPPEPPAVPIEARQAAAARAFSSAGTALSPRPIPPRRPPPISARATPLTSELSAQLFSASDEPNRPGLPVLVAEHEQPGTFLSGPYSSYADELGPHASARRGSTKIWLGAIAAAACCAVAFWALQRPGRPAPDEQAQRAELQPSPPPAPAQEPAAAPPEAPAVEGAAAAAAEPAAVGAVAAVPDEAAPEAPAELATRGARPHRAVARGGVRRATAGQHAEDDVERDATGSEGESSAPQAASAAQALAAELAEPARTEPTPAQEPAPITKLRTDVIEAPPPAPPPKPQLPLAAAAQVQAIVVRGSLATSVVARAVERVRPQFSACYARAANAAGRNGFGEVVVEIQIDERGRASSPRAFGDSLPGLATCVAEVAGKVASDRPDTGTVKASWKVVFAP